MASVARRLQFSRAMRPGVLYILLVCVEALGCLSIYDAANGPDGERVTRFFTATKDNPSYSKDFPNRSYVAALAEMQKGGTGPVYLFEEDANRRTIGALQWARGKSDRFIAVKITSTGEERAEKIRQLRALGVEGFLLEKPASVSDAFDFVQQASGGATGGQLRTSFVAIGIAEAKAAEEIDKLARLKPVGLDLILLDGPLLLESYGRGGPVNIGETPSVAYARAIEKVRKAADETGVALGARTGDAASARDWWVPRGFRHIVVRGRFPTEFSPSFGEEERRALGFYLWQEQEKAKSTGAPQIVDPGNREPLIEELVDKVARASSPPPPAQQWQQQQMQWRRLPEHPTPPLAQTVPNHTAPADAESVLLVRAGVGTPQVGPHYLRGLRPGHLIVIPRGTTITLNGVQAEVIR